MTEIKGLVKGQYKVWRFGRDVPYCEGVTPDIDPQNLQPQNPYLLINTRIEGGVPTLRPGQRLICNVTSGGAGTGQSASGVWNHKLGTARGLYLIGDGCPGQSSGVGSFIGKYDTELRDTELSGAPAHFSSVGYYPLATNPVKMGIYSDDIYFGIDASIQRLGEVSRLKLPTGYSYVSAFMEHEGVFLVALVGTAAAGVGTSAIFTFDGTTFTNVLTAINPVVGFGKYRDMLFAAFNGAPNSIRIRNSVGAWSAPIAPGAGTVRVASQDACDSYKDRAYIPSGEEDIFSLDQTLTLTRLPIATTGVTAGGHVMAVVSAFPTEANPGGFLFYAWHNAAGTTVYIGRYDGTTWNATYKNLTTQGTWVTDGPGGNTLFPPVQARTMKLYRGDLALACVAATGLAPIYLSPKSTVSGAWTRMIPTITVPNGDIRQIVVF